MTAPLIALAERGLVPDAAIRFGIRRLLASRLAEERRRSDVETLVTELADGPVAVHTDTANAQHYEVPAAFFAAILGPRMKYSSALWPPGTESLAAAEEAMLALTAARAGVADGMDVLDLGSGWGSFALWSAERFPNARIVAVSNSASQRAFVTERARALGLANVEAVTADVNVFHTERSFDRVVSVEMFEHVRNHAALMRRIAHWLKPGGRLFVHVFCHRELAYRFETDRRSDWMGRTFFTGGIMPSEDLLARFQDDLRLLSRWRVGGTHYARTLEAWLARLDASRDLVDEVLADCYGAAAARVWAQRWRIFLMACAELFGTRGGTEWVVAHYLFGRR